MSRLNKFRGQIVVDFLPLYVFQVFSGFPGNFFGLW